MLLPNSSFARVLPFALFSLLAALVLGLPVFAQDSTYVVATSPSWIDTGLDLQSGDVLQVSATASGESDGGGCDPGGVSGVATTANLPLPSAPAGALIARTHAQGAPLLIGSGRDVHIEEASHLFLGVNVAGIPPCQGKFAVKVHRVAAAADTNTGADSTSAKTGTQSGNRGDQLKSQLAAAADIFMEGQFGLDKPAASANGSFQRCFHNRKFETFHRPTGCKLSVRISTGCHAV